MDVGSPVGPYLIESVLGRGGMGAVYRARHKGTGQVRALKVMLPAIVAQHPEAAARFLREASLAASVEHPNVARVFDAFEHDGTWVIPMEFIEGLTLDRHLRAVDGARRALAETEAVSLMRGICAGTDAIHARGIVHRDLKPLNILLARSASGEVTPRIVDFGTARLTDDPDEFTRAGIALGTPAYMAPEQVEGRRDLDPRVDVYALGVIAYQMLTGRRPYEDDEREAIPVKVLRRAPFDAPRSLAPTLSPAVEAAVLAALALDRTRRLPSAGAFADALSLACMPEGSSTNVGIERPSLTPEPPVRGRGPRFIAAAALVVTTLAGIGLSRHHDEPRLQREVTQRGVAVLAPPPAMPPAPRAAAPVVQSLSVVRAPVASDAGAPTTRRPHTPRCRPRPGVVCPSRGI